MRSNLFVYFFVCLVLAVSGSFPNVASGEEFKLTASDGSDYEHFGEAVSISGDYVIVGARLDCNDNGANAGSAYVFRCEGDTWVEMAKLTASDGSAGDNFGQAVSVSSNYVIVGSYYDDDNGTNSGSAYIFRHDGDVWEEMAKLTASDGTDDDYFGKSVSISGDYAIVGAFGDDDNGLFSGSAYVFRHEGDAWVEVAKLTASDGAFDSNFGWSVSISGDYATVGARIGANAGSAYVFRCEGDTWVEMAKLTASDGAVNDEFGYSVSISGDYIIVGAPMKNDFSGSAYIFSREGDTWVEMAKISGDELQFLSFGLSVSIFGDYAIVGASGDDDNGLFSGSAYVFRHEGDAWVEVAKLTASDGGDDDHFGSSVSMSGDYIIVGAPQDDQYGTNSGSAYIYDGFEANNQTPQGKFWGIFIGYNFFADNLRGDLLAEDIYDKCEFLTEDRRYLITGDWFKPVTKGRIEEVINDIKLQIKPGDTLFFYLVGHGFSSFVLGSDETTLTAGDECVIINSAGFIPDVSYITDDELTSMFEGLDNVNKWVFIDACQSGGFWGNNNPNDYGDLEKLPNTSLMASAQEDKKSQYIGKDEYVNHPDFGKSFFGILLRLGLSLKTNNRAACDSNDDGNITFNELADWMTEAGKTYLEEFDGWVVNTNDFGDEVIFSIDDWDPVFEKTGDFVGTISFVVQDKINAIMEAPDSAYVDEQIAFDASNSYSPNGGIVMYEWDWDGDGIYEEKASNPIIEHTFTSVYEGIVVLRITDTENENDSTSIMINVVDPNQPPVANAGPGIDLSVSENCIAMVMLDGSLSNDADGDPLTYTWVWDDGIISGVTPSLQLSPGTYDFQLIVNDGTIDSQPDTVIVNVFDVIPPALNISVSPDTLWPPNHKMILITPAMTVSDNCDPDPIVELVSITMNEGDETNTYDPSYDYTTGDGHTIDDIQVDENGNIYVRAERSGSGTGRIYTITYSATDISGNCSTASAVVTVPHNQ